MCRPMYRKHIYQRPATRYVTSHDYVQSVYRTAHCRCKSVVGLLIAWGKAHSRSCRTRHRNLLTTRSNEANGSSDEVSGVLYSYRREEMKHDNRHFVLCVKRTQREAFARTSFNGVSFTYLFTI